MRTEAKKAAVRAALGAAHTRLGRRVVHGALRTLLKLTVDMAPDARFRDVRPWPSVLRGFEDLSFLFTSTQLDNGIAQLTIEEAAHLYRTARDAGAGILVEIGRYKGGSTLLLAAAMKEDARLVSYDLHAVPGVAGPELDAELGEVLRRYQLESRVSLVVADSRTVEVPEGCVLVFVDGDHSYEGVLADYEHWKRGLAPGGHLLFHDSPNTSRLAEGGCEPVGRAVAEIERRDAAYVRRVAQAGTIAHFVRTDEPFTAQRRQVA